MGDFLKIGSRYLVPGREYERINGDKIIFIGSTSKNCSRDTSHFIKNYEDDDLHVVLECSDVIQETGREISKIRMTKF